MNQRPTGVTILAILAFVGGIFSILAGLTLVGFGGFFASAGLGGLALFFGIYAIVWGALALWIGWGFWQLRPSAWRWGIILMVVGIVITIIEIPLGYADLVGAIITIAIDLAIIYYLTTPGVRAAFGQPTTGSMTDAVMMAFGMGGGASSGTAAPPPAPPASPPPASSWSGTGESTPPSAGSDEGGEDRP